MSEDRKTWKSRSGEKVVNFSSTSLFHARKRKAVIQGGNDGDRPPDVEENPGTWYRQRLINEGLLMKFASPD